MQTKFNSLRFMLFIKGPSQKKAEKKEQRPKYKHHILYLINTTLSIITLN